MDLADNGSVFGIAQGLRRAVTGEQILFADAVVGQGVGEAADDGVVLHALGQFGKVLANLNARNGGGNRLELATIFGRGIRFQVEGVLMRRPAFEEHKNAGALGQAGTAIGAGAKDLRKREPSQGSHLEHVPPVKSL